ncbi:unnamed protein product [Rotaria sp. Silwood2]|nr:unnamed protein product [Rotaria sp. Silwood2]
MIHMKKIYVQILSLLVWMILVTPNSVESFYLNKTISILQNRMPNITCWTDMSMVTVNTISFSFFGIPFMYPNMAYGDACIFIQQNGDLLNGSRFYTFLAASLVETNLYRQISRRCGSNFSPENTFIGYGRCNPFPYETWTTDLCICSTNYCNLNYSTCVANVQATSSRPANLPIFVPELNNIISCYTGSHGSTYVNVFNDSLMIESIEAPIDINAFRTYYTTHSVTLNSCILTS